MSSRVENILNGSYTGRPLSRLEEILMGFSSGGGGSGDDIAANQLKSRVSSLESGQETIIEDVRRLKIHAIVDTDYEGL